PLEEDWDSIFAAFARDAGPTVTSRIVGRVVPRARLTAGERARLLLDDGFRLLDARDPAAADRRFAQAATAAPDSAEADKAEVARIWPGSRRSKAWTASRRSGSPSSRTPSAGEVCRMR